MFRRVTARCPDEEEVALLRGLLTRQRSAFRRDPEAAKRLIAVGRIAAADASWIRVELAAWTVVAQAMLNLDEVITRR